MFTQTLKSISAKTKSDPHLIRKLTVSNTDPKKGPLVFEVGRYCSQFKPELGEISAIKKMHDESLEYSDMIHKVWIRKPSGEEVLWKKVYRDRVEEFDVEN
jgi:hypothetical protein